MNILVIGHLCYDEIHLPDREPVSGFGGIFYSVGALGALAGPGDKIIPVFGVGADKKDDLIARLAEFPNVSTEGIFTLNGPTNTVKLFYGKGDERTECSEQIAPPIPVSAVQPYVKRADAVLINMVSGFDITFDMLYMINDRKSSKNVPVYFDIHSMTLGVDEKNKRFRRPVMDWRRWMFYTNIVQMNELEAATLTVERLNEETLAKIMMTLGPSIMLVTLGERGARVYEAEKKKVYHTEITGIKVNRGNNIKSKKVLHDPTGCGDVFGAAFLHHFVKTGDSIASAQYANRVAARKVSLDGSGELKLLSEELINKTE